jgi:D-3-phosphoglycerate dehydrogenase / 2-oxoglutarate reductase
MKTNTQRISSRKTKSVSRFAIESSLGRGARPRLTARNTTVRLFAMKIIVADKISERGLALLGETGWEIATPTAAMLAKEIANADGLIVRSATRVTADLLESTAKLRVVGRAGVGVDNIDVEAATHRGVLVMNTPGGNAVSVAEHTLALMLALARSVPQANAAIQAGRWEKTSSGTELRGKTIGLLGLGRVGTEVARRARALEMKVLAHDPYVTPAAARELEVELVPFEDLLRRSDVISLHTSLGPATEKMINAAALAQMKRGTRLINCARGELIDEAALAEALRSGHLAGAAVDTFAQEPPKNSPLLGLPNLIATPHVAGSTAEAQEEVGTLIAQQVRDYLADGLIRNAVNMPALSAEQYRRLRPYLELGERLGSMVAQAAPSRSLARIRIRYAGEPADLGSHVIRSAVLIGVLNSVLDEKVNLVNASEAAAARGLIVEETTRRRERGFPNTLEVACADCDEQFTVEGTVVHDGTPRILSLDGIELEAPLEGTLLLTRNRDVPGVIGKIGTVLGNLGVNIATFALGRRQPIHGAEAVALVRLDGRVDESVVEAIRAIPAITDARLIRLPEAAKTVSQ